MADERHEWFLNQIFRHRAALYRYLRKFTSGAEDIEDLVQETYVRVYALSYTQAVDSPRALLFRIAHNMAVERARRQKSQATDSGAGFERLTVYSSDAPADEQIDARRRFESFCAAVERLPPLCRRVFVLRKGDRLSPDEIAEGLGLSPRPRSCRCCIIHDVGGLPPPPCSPRSRSVRYGCSKAANCRPWRRPSASNAMSRWRTARS